MPGRRDRKRRPQHHLQLQHERRQEDVNNMFSTLASIADEENGELNAHLTERFGMMVIADINDSRLRPPTTRVVKTTNEIREYYKEPQAPVVGGNWVSKPEIPTPDEIMMPSHAVDNRETIIDVTEGKSPLRPNKVLGAYESIDEYLGTQYDLIREDAIGPLREAVRQVRESPYLDEVEYEGGSIGLYEPVYITSVIFSPRGLAVRIAFSLSRVKKYIRWEQSKRLITGTLVALSPADDCFQSKCLLATVAARPLSALQQNPPEIDLFFARPEDISIDPMQKWIMVEARSSFYEASRHTLQALQHMSREPFPLQEHLVGLDKNIEAPRYLQKNPYVDMSPLVAMNEEDAFQNINVLTDWPDSNAHGLDKSQSEALRMMLTKRLATVQGPPGTGKTYVSVAALKILLANTARDDPPIIVTCQTNHALDQLLLHAAEFESQFIRLGGRSKDRGKIKERTLYAVRMSFSQPKTPHSLRLQSLAAHRRLTKEMQLLLAPLEAGQPPLDHRLLMRLGVLTVKQGESLEMDSLCAMGIPADSPGIQMEQWIGRSLVPCTHPMRPDDFGTQFEEDDFEVEQLQELEAEAVAQDDEDFETLRGERTLLNDNVRGKPGTREDDELIELLRHTDDLYTIPVRDRGSLYNYFQRETKRLLCERFRVLAKEYQKIVLQLKIARWEQDYGILRDQKLIGMTTTGLSKYRALIAALHPKIVMVEEAAETLEAPVTAACLPSLEHLILVGDHQQLRPHCQVRNLEDEPFNLNFSLFERIVLNELEMACLTRQRRMIPEIRRLLQPIYGKNLEDHPTVKNSNNRPPVEGMGCVNSFFFHHEWPESVDGNRSSMNEKEADMIVGFVDYLVLNGIDPAKITVLTFYNGQRKCIASKLSNHPNLKSPHIAPIKVVTVDSYQGEENDIVILSLVRSNKRHNIGFLSVDNRVCVALSRARRGFYLFGNARMLACESATWAEVVETMYGKKESSKEDKRRHLGFFLPLQCQRHERKVFMQEPEDWELINGGCDMKCRCLLPCGHICMKRCHPFAADLINCTQKCTKRVEMCGHPCTKLCCEQCACQRCDIRSDGTHPMLKPMPRNGARAPKQLPPPPPVPLLGETSGDPSHGVGDWHAYANGGHAADDAEFVRKLQEGNTKYVETKTAAEAADTGKLIELSPATEKVAASSQNAELLIDVDAGVGGGSQTLEAQPNGTSYAAAAAAGKKGKKKKTKPVQNLLD
ncbi:P-loop containing nucleoside triphosphate hydrolase protein [Westerdykella ornata]|uniref:P-loop containing nucleoside triphosphate hydrolase protein n=1 Tax=Westerdykella ornata TaxID=318751 RepID=A0A6A6J8P6_WESOR|nr:P-loop containing nucleoside triphosphate hydrolase protein [Westerdykella ornata]KAF2272378.1 P-loop containing nucleoside triphosphate hydrolase protein [Westerdykella ornata]